MSDSHGYYLNYQTQSMKVVTRILVHSFMICATFSTKEPIAAEAYNIAISAFQYAKKKVNSSLVSGFSLGAINPQQSTIGFNQNLNFNL